jgi:hypothetical protein
VRLATSRYTPRGYIRTIYTDAEIDAVGVYSPELGRCFLIPIADVAGRTAMHLRLKPAKNNQAERITWARRYEFGAVIEQLARPQLERVLA